jgi:predicted RNA binding protein YcfA (HicA-like mRNA interferase family)
MTRRQKRLAKIRNNQKNVSKSELDQVLRDYGFVRREGKGSHTVYQHPSEATPVVVAAHGQHVPTYIVKQVLGAIERVSEREATNDSSTQND